MTDDRQLHSATLLANGKVLIAGGVITSGAWRNSAELYDPATGTFAMTGSMFNSRYSHSATLLTNGKVLIAGGFHGSFINAAELYDPTAGTFSNTGGMSSPRAYQTATLLPNGKVLITGGQNGGALNSVDLYDPAAGTFSPVSALTVPRYYHTATLLPSGRIFLAGGYGAAVLNSTELYETGLTFSDSRRPVVSSATFDGTRLTLAGSGFKGDSESSTGAFNSSPSNYPLLQLTRLDNEQTSFILSDPSTDWSATSFVSTDLSSLPKGHYRTTVFTNAIPSLSKVVLIVPPTNQTLNITFAGSGGDRVDIAATPPVASCSGDCTRSIPDGSSITLTPFALSGSAFKEWSGDCSGTGDCILTMSSTKTVTATFQPRCLLIAQIIAPATSSTGSYNVSWSASTSGATYTLYEGGVAVPACTNISTNYCSFTGKSNGTYNYTVKASKTGYADSALTGPATTVVTLACAPIATLTVPATSSTGKYTVSWGLSSAGSSYTLYEGGVAVPACTNISATTCALTGKGNGSYSYTVQATKTGYTPSPVKGPASITVTLACTPIATINVPTTTNTTGNYTVSWGASTSGSTYYLYENSNPIPIYTGSGISYAVTGRTSGSYQYRVVAKKSGYLDSPTKTSNTVTVVRP
jgi:hypothetical protein